jgi:hypothetical protein
MNHWRCRKANVDQAAAKTWNVSESEINTEDVLRKARTVMDERVAKVVTYNTADEANSPLLK